MFTNGKISDRGKKCITWLIAICTFLVLLTVCVRSCQRHIECDINASRNRVTIQLSPDAHSLIERFSKKDRK